jgi:CTP synthase
MANANSTEMDAETPYPVIAMMEEQKALENKGGTMRLGAYPCVVKEGSKAFAVYGKKQISERHRHRYEFNNAYIDAYRNGGMLPVGTNPQTQLVEIVELQDHPWFIGVQYHPEYKSTVARPHPLFIHFVKAAMVAQGTLEPAKGEQVKA